MKVLFLTQTSELGPSSRYRVYQLIPLLEQQGLRCEVSPGLDSDLYTRMYLGAGPAPSRLAAFRAVWEQRHGDLERLREFDLVVVQKGIFPGLWSGFERRMAARRPLVIDLDDAIWLPREGGSRLLRWLHRERAVQEVFRLARAVIAGNDFLGEYARQFNAAVTVVPSSIDLTQYSRTPSLHHSGPPVIGWIGSRSTLPYLKPLGPVFTQLRVLPRVIGSGDASSLGFAVDFRPWRPETELTDLAGIDIGIAPLPDNPWDHGKCGVKALQYLACGIPVVASPVGVHQQIIRDGVNGYLASTEAEWVDRLRQLLNDGNLRARLGAAGRETVARHYDIRTAAEAVGAVLRSALARSNV